jgi:hypothetical protein
MARNKISDLNDHLFAQLERLNDEEITSEDLDKEVNKAKAISQVASQIIKANKLTIDAMRLVANGTVSLNEMPENFGLKQISS